MEPPRHLQDGVTRPDANSNDAQNRMANMYQNASSSHRKHLNEPTFENSQASQNFPVQYPASAPPYSQYYDPNQFMAADPVMNIAKAYGGHFAEQGKQQLEKFVSIGQLKYYFDVDNAYVGKKLALIFFPFAHKEWSVQYDHEQRPLPPRHDVNAPDLYISAMAIVTYIVLAGVLLGTQNRFSPEKLGICASSALAWLLFENILVLIAKYVMNISQSMRVWDTLAFSSYKFVCMNACLVSYLFMDKSLYYGSLAYCSLAIVFFLIRSVKGFVLENFSGSDGRKRKLYLLLFISLSQPFIIWWLTSSVISYHKVPVKFELPDDFEM